MFDMGMTLRGRIWAALLVTSLLPSGLTAQQESEKEAKNRLIAELAAKLEPVTPRKPGASREQMQVRPGFRVDLVAAEPDVRDPVAVDFDALGRMYVVELPQYNAYAVETPVAKGSVRRLADTDGDGIYDQSVLFADGLEYPTAVACWAGGIFVGAAPDLLYLKDTNRDGRADVRKVVFTGFGRDKAGEAHLNSIRWGLDNRFHLSTSLSGGDVRATAPGGAPPVSVRGRGLIFDPHDLSEFELTSGGGQHGMSMDDWGRKFVCSNSVPAQTLMYDDRYLARNPYTKSPAAAVDIAPEGKFTRLFRISPNEPWRVLRTTLRREGRFRGSDEGGKPFGFFTAATGITVYRGHAWPAQFAGSLLVGDAANNLVYRARLATEDLRLVARRAEPGREFVASRDIWTRPVQFANAPDGNLYFLDIYRSLIEGAAFLPPEFLPHLKPVGGNDRGRIYRIATADFQATRPPNLRVATIQQLVEMLDHPNGWHRDTAARLIYQRQDRSAIRPLREMVVKARLSQGRMTAMYALRGLSALPADAILSGLQDVEPMVRVHALKLAEPVMAEAPEIASHVSQMTNDADPRVRYQLAFSLGYWDGRASIQALVRLARMDAHDQWVRLALLSSLNETGGVVFSELLADQEFTASKHGPIFLVALAEQIGAANRDSQVAAVLQALQQVTTLEQKLAQRIVEGLVTRLKDPARRSELTAAGGKAAEILAELIDQAKLVAVDNTQPFEHRVEAIRSLRLAPFTDTRELLERCFDLQQPDRIQAAVIETLGAYREPAVASVLLTRWQTLSPALRAAAAETLLSRPSWIAAFLKAVGQERVRRAEVDPARIALLQKHPDPLLSRKATELFGAAQPGRRLQIVEAFQPALQRQGDPARGQQVFKKVCSACHRLEGVGTALGADLRGIRNRGLAAILLNILDPNREVKPKYLAYVVTTLDARVITGMIESESANSLLLRRPDGVRVEVPRAEIDQMSSTGLSFMPEGLEKELDLAKMADLLAYLDSLR
ncbi:MAG: hypothetical protein CMJ75_14660 [Planctomycetaceae bacterium]|nr:hypothetical protein [Planctomycetaceae bacterium]